MINFDEFFETFRTEGGSGFIRFTSKGGYHTIGGYFSPFFNCQNSSLAGFDQLLIFKVRNNLTVEDIRQIIHVMLSQGGNRSLLLLDVHQNIKSFVKEIFYDCDFIFENNYESTNGSDMIMFYINVEPLFEKCK